MSGFRKMCHVYAVTTKEGIKEICNNDIFGEHIVKANIMSVRSFEEVLFYFETFIVHTDVAYELLEELKKYRYYECVFIPFLEAMRIRTFATNGYKEHLRIRRTVDVYADNEGYGEPMSADDLDALGIPLPWSAQIRFNGGINGKN